MKFLHLFFRFFFVILLSSVTFLILINFFLPILKADSLIFPYAIHPFDICKKIPTAWKNIKNFFTISLAFNLTTFFNSIFSFIFIKHKHNKPLKVTKSKKKLDKLNLFIGKAFDSNESIYLNEKNLYQNILITGTIGSGKTSSAMYPFTKQLIRYNSYNKDKKIGMLILDVKGNFYKQVEKYSDQFDILDDLVVLEIGGYYKYNPLHKPNLKPAVLANRLKTILTLFSSNNSESYWLDKAEQILTECIKLCRIYNNRICDFC